MTQSQTIAQDVVALLRARNPLLWVVTREEARVERYLFEAAAAANFVPRTWDVGQGVADISGNVINSIGGADPGDTLNAIKERARLNERAVWIMRDLPAWLTGPAGATTLRQVRNLARFLPTTRRDCAQSIIVLSPSAEIPAELQGHATLIDWPLPDRAEIASILDAAIDSLPEDIKATAAPNGTREAAIDAAVGLNGEEAAACYARSLVQFRKIDPSAVAREKKRVIARERVLEWYDPLPGGLDAVGGLELLKQWLKSRSSAYSRAARDYGLPSPKGAMLVGIPGCGKTLTAKAIATAWGVPLLKVDLGAMKSKFVGESEGNLRRALRVIEAIGRCVVWIDEIEKGLQGATSGAADGGVSSDALGTILNWMQERQGAAFVIATANDVSALPPELMRKGRFDEVWWVDLPTQTERVAILNASLRTVSRDKNFKAQQLAAVATACDGFIGSEIAALVPDALFTAFNDNARELTSADLLAAAKRVVPMSKMAAEKITRLRDWARGRARPASNPDDGATDERAPIGREIDL